MLTEAHGDVTLRIEHRAPELIVETTSRGPSTRHALQRYTTDGLESKSIGADGDEFHSIVVWRDDALVCGRAVPWPLPSSAVSELDAAADPLT